MKKITVLILLFCLIVSTCPVLARDTTVISPKTYGVDNLNNEKGDLYIAFLGGSITQGSGASGTIEYKENAGTGSARWSTQITKRYFQKKYPNKNVIEVNAGIGGTNSNLGLFRMKKHMIDKCGLEGPDVVFVEFAVNDRASSAQDVKQRMEGIVRQLAQLPKQPVVIFIYTIANDDVNGAVSGFQPYLNSAAAQQEVADYYNIGSVHLGEYVVGGTDLEGNPIIWDRTNKDPNSWTADGTHPNNKGYTGYSDYIIKQFEEHPEQYFKRMTWREYPMSDYEFGSPQLVSPVNNENVTTTKTWTFDKNLESGWFKDGVLKTVQGGASMTFHFTGRSIGIFSAFGSQACNASYVIDLGSANPISGQLTPHASYNYWMAAPALMRNDLSMGEHTIKITAYSPTNDTKDGFVVGYFMTDPEQPDPIVSKVTLNEKDSVVFGNTLEASYSYINAEKEEGETVTQWLVSDRKNGSYTPIEGENGTTYTPGTDMVGKYMKYRVIPKDLFGNVGKAVESAPVLVSLPSAHDCFSTKGISFSNEGEATVASSTVTNILEDGNLKVSLVMAEYQMLKNGSKKLLQTKRENREIKAGETVTLSAKLTITDTTDKLVQATVWTDPGMEPITPIAQLIGGKVKKVTYIDTEQDKEEASVFVYEINWMN